MAASFLLCYVDQHDAAYRWAQRRKIETHPKTGAAQIVELRETAEEVTVYREIVAGEPAPAKPREAKRPLFRAISEDDLLGYGVPSEWFADVLAATEDSLFALADHFTQEAVEALLELATGCTPAAPEPQPAVVDPFAHPDAQRRFRILANVEELERALDFPWER